MATRKRTVRRNPSKKIYVVEFHTRLGWEPAPNGVFTSKRDATAAVSSLMRAFDAPRRDFRIVAR